MTHAFPFPSFRGLIVAASLALLATGTVYGGPSGAAFSGDGDDHAFGNATVAAHWQIVDGRFDGLVIEDQLNDATIPVTAPFKLELDDGSTFGVDNMRVLTAPHAVKLDADPEASRLAARLPGKAVDASFGDEYGRFRVDWRLVQRKGSHYLRQIVTITALKQDEKLARVDLLNAKVDGAHVVGSVDGSPMVAGHDYLGFESPLSHTSRGHGWSDDAHMWIDRELPLRKGKPVTYSAVVGVTRPTQLRRDFATYVERERAHPYRPFLHYNTYYDLGAYTQDQALERITAFGEELVDKRHVTLDSFLFDGGWEQPNGTWKFREKAFPNGFEPICKAASAHGAAPGIWMSPWGGYGGRDKTVAAGRKLGFEVINGGFALSGPRYYRNFHHVVMSLLEHDCINMFKFDGTGNVNSVFPGSLFDSDFAAMIQLIKDIRAKKPDTFINLSTGTWASPFWLRYTDAVWRNGASRYEDFDHSFAGVGTRRQQWITYRDRQVYRNIVEKGPLFPVNSLMLHGIIYAQHAEGLDTDPGDDFASEVRSFFATGTDLQEMYITPSLLTPHNWDVLAKAAKWSRAHADVLQDVHWVGGDPGRLDVYGWAAWTPEKAIITFRNPADTAQQVLVDLRRQLELPPDAASRFRVNVVWKGTGSGVPAVLDATHARAIRLAPFEVLTLELTPVAAD